MSTAPSKLRSARATIELTVRPRDAQADERFIAAVAKHFGHVTNRQALPPEAPPNVTHLQIASSASQVSVSAAAIDLQVQFFGSFVDDPDAALSYFHGKVAALVHGARAHYPSPTFLTLIAQVWFPSDVEDPDAPTSAILDAHLKTNVPADRVQEANSRIAIRHHDFYVNFHVAAYEERQYNRPVIPGVPVMVQPWETDVVGRGIEFTVDVNNRLWGMTNKRAPDLDDGWLNRTFTIVRQSVVDVAPDMVSSGTVPTSFLNS